MHFAFFLAAFAGLGLGVAAFSRSLSLSGDAPRWVAWLGFASGALLCLSWLTFIKEILFLPFFFGIVLGSVWLVAVGIRLVRANASIERSVDSKMSVSALLARPKGLEPLAS